MIETEYICAFVGGAVGYVAIPATASLIGVTAVGPAAGGIFASLQAAGYSGVIMSGL